jgi:threonine dehydratase
MADGIAVGMPGDVPFEVLERLGVEVRTVNEAQIARALLAMAERSKLLAEPSGAVAVAAIMAEHDAALDVPPPPADPPPRSAGVIVPIITGGNIDPILLSRVIQRGMVAAGRYLQLRVLIDDRPGSLARLVGVIAETRGNIVEVRHSRMDLALGVFDATVTLEIEAKGHTHCDAIIEAVLSAGFIRA